ncbi:hypothetical protein [Methyloceanibacter superfactus]|uniref:hypothetical protein n=1 Tax=Methyloceanibacter superfactus TaxID=1774969 RepID=UPI00114CD9AE|nr:hypothetical protein [Methyloceanibacter superfactus]
MLGTFMAHGSAEDAVSLPVVVSNTKVADDPGSFFRTIVYEGTNSGALQVARAGEWSSELVIAAQHICTAQRAPETPIVEIRNVNPTVPGTEVPGHIHVAGRDISFPLSPPNFVGDITNRMALISSFPLER